MLTYYSVSCCTTTTEGSRTCTGKPSSPRGGLVSVLVDSVMEGIVILSAVSPLMCTPMIGIVNDIYIVPVNISYDKVMIYITCSLNTLPYFTHSFLKEAFITS